VSSLKNQYQQRFPEAGCDEAGRGCLAGPVFAAAVILPPDFFHPLLNDSKQMKVSQRNELRTVIENEALSWAVASCTSQEIDHLNILRASITSMHRALDQLSLQAEFIIVDGNKFLEYKKIPHQCIVKGDTKYFSIAAASVLAKTYRDEYMEKAHTLHPVYGWDQNKGYPTDFHRKALISHGSCSEHRKSFRLLPDPVQGTLDLG
jgi:ribonuclease HII